MVHLIYPNQYIHTYCHLIGPNPNHVKSNTIHGKNPNQEEEMEEVHEWFPPVVGLVWGGEGRIQHYYKNDFVRQAKLLMEVGTPSARLHKWLDEL